MLVLSSNEGFGTLVAVGVALVFVEALAVVVPVFCWDDGVDVGVDVFETVFAVVRVCFVVALSVVELVTFSFEAVVVGRDLVGAVCTVGGEVRGFHYVVYNGVVVLKETDQGGEFHSQ